MRLCAPFFPIQCLAGENEFLEVGIGLGFGAAQLRQFMRGQCLQPGGLGLGSCLFRDVLARLEGYAVSGVWMAGTDLTAADSVAYPGLKLLLRVRSAPKLLPWSWGSLASRHAFPASPPGCNGSSSSQATIGLIRRIGGRRRGTGSPAGRAVAAERFSASKARRPEARARSGLRLATFPAELDHVCA